MNSPIYGMSQTDASGKPAFHTGDDWFDYLRRLDAWKTKQHIPDGGAFSIEYGCFGSIRVIQIINLQQEGSPVSGIQDVGVANASIADHLPEDFEFKK